MAGNDSYDDINIYHKIIFNSKIEHYLNPSKIIICNDTRLSLAAGNSSRNGIRIICGTGSNCFSINEKGEEAKANGWYYILDDEGSVVLGGTDFFAFSNYGNTPVIILGPGGRNCHIADEHIKSKDLLNSKIKKIK